VQRAAFAAVALEREEEVQEMVPARAAPQFEQDLEWVRVIFEAKSNTNSSSTSRN
jgi:hypothetical protein